MTDQDGQCRLSVNISEATADAICEFMADEDVSATEAVRHLIGYGAIVWRADRAGKEVLLKSGRRLEQVRLFAPMSSKTRGPFRRHLRLVRDSMPWHR